MAHIISLDRKDSCSEVVIIKTPVWTEAQSGSAQAPERVRGEGSGSLAPFTSTAYSAFLFGQLDTCGLYYMLLTSQTLSDQGTESLRACDV